MRNRDGDMQFILIKHIKKTKRQRYIENKNVREREGRR